MKQWKKQTGLTLIEVLATVAILSIVTVIVYGVFANGLHYSSEAEDTVLIQQEANYILMILKEQHEKSESYTITVSDDYTKVVISNSNHETITIDNPNYLYKIYRYDPSTPDYKELFENQDVKEIHSKDHFPVIIVIESTTNPDLTYTIKTILSRL